MNIEIGNHQPELSETQIENLKQLRDFMREEISGKTGMFDMDSFMERIPYNHHGFGTRLHPETAERFKEKYQENKSQTMCGTAACAVGWTPFVPGIDSSSYVRETYQERDALITVLQPGASFSDLAIGVYTDGDDYVFQWLFESFWSVYDNTAEGVARRIDHMLEHGIPYMIEKTDHETVLRYFVEGVVELACDDEIQQNTVDKQLVADAESIIQPLIGGGELI